MSKSMALPSNAARLAGASDGHSIEYDQAVAVDFLPLVGAAPRSLRLSRCLKISKAFRCGGCVVRVPTFAKCGEFSGCAHDSSGPVVIGSALIFELSKASRPRCRAPAVSYEDIGGLHAKWARVREIVELPLKHRAFSSAWYTRPKACSCTALQVPERLCWPRSCAESRVPFLHLNGPELCGNFTARVKPAARSFEDAAAPRSAILH